MLDMFKKAKDKEIDITSLNQILKAGKKIMNIGLIMAIVALILLGTYLIKEWKIILFLKELLIVVSPIFIGIIIAWFFDPIVNWLEKKLPRIIACIIVYLLFLGILFLAGYILIPSLLNQIKDFVTTAPTIFQNITNNIIHFIKRLDGDHSVNIQYLTKEITDYLTTMGTGIISDIPKYIITTGKSIINGGINFVLGLMIGFYLLYDFNKFHDVIGSLLPIDWRENYNELTHRINTSLRSYIQGLLTVMMLVFITQSIGLTIAGIEAPILFAIFCAVTDIIPYFGPYIGAIPAVIVGFTMSPITGICVIISILVVQLLENNFYQPLIMGHTMELHPVTIMVGLLIFQHFFGIIGMVIATPVIACLKVLFKFLNEKYEFIKFKPIEIENEDKRGVQ